MTKTTAMGHMPKPDDRAYWLRVFAGQAMQGILAGGDSVGIMENAAWSVRLAVALLDAIDAHEKEAGNAE